MLLIHPVHRRYIKILRNQVEKGTPVLLTQSDLDGFNELFRSTKQKGKRHRRLYKLTLNAMNRPKEESQKVGISGVLGNEEINYIEKALAKAERRGVYATIMGTILWFCRRKKLLKVR